MKKAIQTEPEKAILVGVSLPDDEQINIEESLDELESLATTSGAITVSKIIQNRKAIDSGHFIGKGKAAELKRLAKEFGAKLIIFDNELSPAQVKNLEKTTEVKVLDRSGLILDIFALHAKSKEARTQVELAQLEYLMPRLTRQWTHFSESFGGIGTKGPGETQLETDRRLIRKRITKLKDDLLKIQRQRETQRKGRRDIFKVALVGYTNVGKSTLFNALSDAEVLVEDMLFATLDSTVRKIEVGQQIEVLISDTVGFIKKLPHSLVASFKSTLEEAGEADLLLHVVDISSPNFREQIGAVNTVLDEINLRDKQTLLIFNKVDRLETTGLIEQVSEEFENSVTISAGSQIGIDDVREKVHKIILENFVVRELQFPISDFASVPKVYQLAEVLERQDTEEFVYLKIRASKGNFNLIQKL